VKRSGRASLLPQPSRRASLLPQPLDRQGRWKAYQVHPPPANPRHSQPVVLKCIRTADLLIRRLERRWKAYQVHPPPAFRPPRTVEGLSSPRWNKTARGGGTRHRGEVEQDREGRWDKEREGRRDKDDFEYVGDVGNPQGEQTQREKPIRRPERGSMGRLVKFDELFVRFSWTYQRGDSGTNQIPNDL